ncbi:hypothetical protein K502DRAFT_325386 [Neoconidiobolus thromboides FSU 785]|nr:hypothetical protein K502DRAFT_325386 [Neoconidiobolus thromboides FSU 785]
MSFNVSQSTLAKGHFNFTSNQAIDLPSCGSTTKDKLSLRFAPLGSSNYVLSNSKGINLASIRHRIKQSNGLSTFQADLSNSCNVPWTFKGIAIESDETGLHLPRLKVINSHDVTNYYRWTVNSSTLEDHLSLVNLNQPKELIASYPLPSRSSQRTSELNFFEGSSDLTHEMLLLFILFLSVTLSTSSDPDINPGTPSSTPPGSNYNSCKSSSSSRSNSTKSIKSVNSPNIPALVTRKSSEVLIGDHLW